MSDRPTPGHGPAVLSTPGLVVLAVVAFAVELALFGGVGAIAYSAVGGGLTAWLAALAGTAAVVLLWGLFMAPKARFRLAAGARGRSSQRPCAWARHTDSSRSGFSAWGWFVGVAGLAVVAAQVALPTASGERP